MFRFQGGGEVIEIIIRDETGTKLDFFKFRMKDPKRFRGVLNILKNKYDFKPFERKDKDIDWLRKQNL